MVGDLSVAFEEVLHLFAEHVHLVLVAFSGIDFRELLLELYKGRFAALFTLFVVEGTEPVLQLDLIELIASLLLAIGEEQ
jgi:hypothetical protein